MAQLSFGGGGAAVELLPPSHFTLVPPASYLTQGETDARDGGRKPEIEGTGSGRPFSASPKPAASAALATAVRERAQLRRDERRFIPVQLNVDAKPAEQPVVQDAPPRTVAESRKVSTAESAEVKQVRADSNAHHQTSAAKEEIFAATHPQQPAPNERSSEREAVARVKDEKPRLGTVQHLSLPNARSREEEERMLAAWLPKKKNANKYHPTPTSRSNPDGRITRYRQQPQPSPVARSESAEKSYRPRQVQVEADMELEDNAEAVLARSLAKCHKIDKSLEFYAGIREKWRDRGQQISALQAVQSSPQKEVVSPDVPVQRKGALHGQKSQSSHDTKAVGRRDRKQNALSEFESTSAIANGIRATPTTATARAKNKDVCEALAVRDTDRGRAQGETFAAGGKTSKSQGVTREAVRETRNVKKASTTAERVAAREYTRREPFPSRLQLGTTAGRVAGQPLNDLDSLSPEPRKKVVSVPAPTRANKSRSVEKSVKTSQTVRITPKVPIATNKVAKGSVSGTGTANITLPTKPVTSPPLKKKGESERMPQRPERFSQIKLEIAVDRTVVPHSEPQTRRSEEEEEEFNDFDSVPSDNETESIEPLIGTFGKPVLTGALPIHPPPSPLTKGHTSHEANESEAVREKPHTKSAETRNDTAIARVLQAEEESRAGVSLKPSDTSSDREIALQIQAELSRQSGPTTGDRPSKASSSAAAAAAGAAVGRGVPLGYFEQGHELGREFGNEYERRHEQGYRNLASERGQPYERRTNASEHFLEREQQDLAFEGLQDLEIDTGLDAQIITRISHVYTYKSTHHPKHESCPKHESVKPLTQCLVCLDDFHEGQPLRLMPCTHTFHRYCIDKWLEQNRNCPVCKHDIIVLARKMGVQVDQCRRKRW